MTSPAGVCRFCGCSYFDPCPYGCGWANPAHTVCSSCAPAAKAEAYALRNSGPPRRVSDRDHSRLHESLGFVAAFHRGFVVGWFDVTARSPYGRNPFRREASPNGRAWWSRHEAWNRGQRSGEEASRAYQRVCGPLMTAPRREVLHGSGRR